VACWGLTNKRQGRISPFFFKKKGDKQRLVLDCRSINQAFRKPPRLDMGAADSLGRLHNPRKRDTYVGTADIMNCFYQCGVCTELSEHFCFEDIDASIVKSWGATQDIHGNILPDSGVIAPCLLILPMGWTWSFWLVQTMHEEFLAEAGFSSSSCLVSQWSAPPLSEVPIAMPYCDNLTLLGHDEKRVNADLSRLILLFESKGFELHEIEWAGLTRDILGARFDGHANVVRPRGERSWTPRGAILYASRESSVMSGQQLEKLLGHFVVDALHSRLALSIFRAAILLHAPEVVCFRVSGTFGSFGNIANHPISHCSSVGPCRHCYRCLQ
jgi:hypothetical protein